MIIFCWLFSYGMQLPTLFKVWGAFGYDKKLGTCSIITDVNGRSSKTPLFVIAFVIPCIIIVVCYARIFWVVHKSEQRMRQHSTAQHSIPNNLRPPLATQISQTHTNNLNQPSTPSSSSISNNKYSVTSAVGQQNNQQKAIRIKDQRDVKAKRNEWRITKMVLAIFLSFVFCYLPITIAKIADKEVKAPGEFKIRIKR